MKLLTGRFIVLINDHLQFFKLFLSLTYSVYVACSVDLQSHQTACKYKFLAEIF